MAISTPHRERPFPSFRWEHEPGADALVHSLSEDFAELTEQPGVVLVKHNRVRTVLRVERGGAIYFVKHFHPRGLAERLKAWIRGGRARTEARNLRRLAGQGLPVPELLAAADGPGGHGGLITRDVGLGRELADALEEEVARGSRALLALLRGLGQLVGRLHRGGAVHWDLHAGNLLLLESGKLALLDFHKLSWPLCKTRGRLDDLARLGRSLQACLSRSRCFALLQAYLRELDGRVDRRRLRGLAIRVGRAMRRQHRVRLRSRTRRCLLNSSRYVVEQADGYRIWRQRQHSREELLAVLARHRRKEGQLLKLSRRTTVRHLPAPFAAAGVVVKGCRTFWTEKLQALFYHGRARQAWIAALGMQVRGLATPEALALFEERRWGLLRQAWLLTRFVEDGELLDAFLQRRLAEMPARAQHDLATELGRQLGRLHRQGVYHRDLKPPNLMLRAGPQGRECLFLDLDDTFFWRRLSWRRRIGNLAQLLEAVDFQGLGVRRSLQRRFFTAYLRLQPRGMQTRERTMLAAIQRAAAERRQRRQWKLARAGRARAL